jgi:hypothetical protein
MEEEAQEAKQKDEDLLGKAILSKFTGGPLAAPKNPSEPTNDSSKPKRLKSSKPRS